MILSATTGTVPGARLDACAAASEDGSKIVLFGGELDVNNWLNSIFILDVATRIWKQGPSVIAPRSQAACGYHDGQFIVVGGTGSNNMGADMHNSQPLVFNVGTNLWETQFTPTTLPTPSPSNGRGGEGGGGGGGQDGMGGDNSQMAAIIGGAVGGTVVLLGGITAVVVLIGKRKQRRRDQRRDVFLTGDRRTQGPDAAANALPRETAAFIIPSHHRTGGRGGGSYYGDDDEDYSPHNRPRSPPSDYHPYKGFASTENYSTASGSGSTSAAIAAPLLTGAGPSSRPPSDAAKIVNQSDPTSFYYAQMQQQHQYPPPRASSYLPRTSYAPPSSPTYSDQTESTAFAYSSTLIGQKSPPSPLIPARPPIPPRPVSRGSMEVYTLNTFEEKTAPIPVLLPVPAPAPKPVPASVQAQERVVSVHAPQFRGEEHAQLQAHLDQQHSQPYAYQYQTQPHQQQQQEQQQQYHPYQPQQQQHSPWVQSHPTTGQYRLQHQA
ncbi:hypothetical protein BGX24_009949 [Mortierella sp. AD032]|nr:hypothetical protein BGX24_009949 [Mortierella sp. AD032]